MDLIKELIEFKNPLEAYLGWVHSKEYQGTDDDMPDSFENWITSLDTEEMLEHGNVLSRLLLDYIKEKHG